MEKIIEAGDLVIINKEKVSENFFRWNAKHNPELYSEEERKMLLEEDND